MEAQPVRKRVVKPRAKRPSIENVTLYVARGGAPRSEADYEVAFPSRPEAIAFLVNQHGLTFEEQKKLAKASSLKLKRKWHGSDACAVRELRVPPNDVPKALRGELFGPS